MPSSVLFSFSGTPPSALPSGTGVPQAVPTGAQGPGGSVYICHPVDPSAVSASYPGDSSNATLSAIPSGPVPTSTPLIDGSSPATGALPMPTGGAPVPTGGQGSDGPVYICYPADSAAAPAPNPSGPVPASNAPNPSALAGTDIPKPVPSGSQPSGGPSYVCRPADPAAAPAPSTGTPSDAPLTLIPSGPAPTSTPTPDATVPSN